MKIKLLILLASFTLLSSCASLPDAKLGYYLPKSEVSVNVTRMLMCSSADDLIISNSAEISVSHRANLKKAKFIELPKLNSTFSSSEFTYELYPDGRLKSINTKSEGQGDKVVDSVISLVTSFSGRGFKNKAGQSPNKSLCDAINAPAKDGTFGRDKAITLKYKKDRMDPQINSHPLTLNAESQQIYTRLGNAINGNPVLDRIIGGVEVNFGQPVTKSDLYEIGKTNQNTTSKGVLAITLQRTQEIPISITAGVGGRDILKDKLVENKPIEIAANGEEFEYNIAIPKPKPFGTLTSLFTFSEAGAITKASYTASPNASAAISNVQKALDETAGDTYAQKAAEAKARADLIAQQQRLLLCEADPKSCPVQ